MRVSCPWRSPALQHTVHTPWAAAASASAGTDSAVATRAERGSIRNSRRPVVVAAHTVPGPAASRTTGGSLVSMPGTARLRRVTGSTPTTSPPAATQTTPRLTAMSSTRAVRAILVMPSAAAGRLLVVTAGRSPSRALGGRVEPRHLVVASLTPRAQLPRTPAEQPQARKRGSDKRATDTVYRRMQQPRVGLQPVPRLPAHDGAGWAERSPQRVQLTVGNAGVEVVRARIVEQVEQHLRPLRVAWHRLTLADGDRTAAPLHALQDRLRNPKVFGVGPHLVFGLAVAAGLLAGSKGDRRASCLHCAGQAERLESRDAAPRSKPGFQQPQCLAGRDEAAHLGGDKRGTDGPLPPRLVLRVPLSRVELRRGLGAGGRVEPVHLVARQNEADGGVEHLSECVEPGLLVSSGGHREPPIASVVARSASPCRATLAGRRDTVVRIRCEAAGPGRAEQAFPWSGRSMSCRQTAPA